jgi:hypothetical protein
MFFEKEDNVKILGAFLRKAEAAHIEDESRNNRLSICKKIIEFIYKSPKSWDDKCRFNIKNIGDQFLSGLRGFDSSKSEDIDDIYSMSYRFLCEYDFLVGPGKELNFDLRSIINKIQQDVAEMEENVRSQIIYASYVMPANIAKELINDANIGTIKDLEQKAIEAKNLKEQWDKELESKKAETDALKEKLDEYKTGFNFVGLYNGFEALAEKKSKESFWLFWSLIGIGVIILTPLIFEIILSSLRIYNMEDVDLGHFLVLVPLVSVELILIYFFRVVLLNHRSVKAQLMQIELRQTLCQFIQSYAEYSAKIKKQDTTALEKFESLIFSGLLSDPEKLPSTFDGLEQISALIKSIKNS